MADRKGNHLSRRAFVRASAAVAVGGWAAPHLCLGAVRVERPMKRTLGRTGFEVTTLGLGGQAMLQWTEPGPASEKIILKAFELGLNYFDTANIYGASQLSLGRAFRTLKMVPGLPGYDETRRRSVFLASKTHMRSAKGLREGVNQFTQGPKGSTAIDDLKRTVSQVFGDGKGNYPTGAYLDLFQIHSLNNMLDIETIYEGLDDPDPKAPRIGALAGLLDYRDGTNRTGLNPKQEKLIRHIGISGHRSSPVMIECLQRDTDNVLDTMLVAVNANDRRHLNHQYNVVPVAAAKGMGIIAMKAFADAVMYGKEPRWSRGAADVVRRVGSPTMPSAPLVRYSLTTLGISMAIIGTGHVDTDPAKCQLQQNLTAAQIEPDGFGQSDRRAVEQQAARVRDGKTNYFQLAAEPLGPPRQAAVGQQVRNQQRLARLTWQMAYAGDEPIERYEIRRDGRKVAQVEHRPQTTKSRLRMKTPCRIAPRTPTRLSPSTPPAGPLPVRS